MIKNKIIVICNTNGSAFIGGYEILKELDWFNQNYEFQVITDRACGIEKYCKEQNIIFHRIEINNNEKFSNLLYKHLSQEKNIHFVCLFFTRLITSILFENYKCYNIHPSLLPSFKGFKSVENALNMGVNFFGATLHKVDHSIDGGKIIGQTLCPLNGNENIKIFNSISFIQKVYLFLSICFLMDFQKKIFVIKSNKYHSNPIINDQNLKILFRKFLKKHNFFELKHLYAID